MHVAAIAEELARVDVSSAVTFNDHCSCASLINRLGSAEQSERLLAQVVEGSLLALAVSEPEAGSDAAAVRTTAERRGDSYVASDGPGLGPRGRKAVGVRVPPPALTGRAAGAGCRAPARAAPGGRRRRAGSGR
jgi:hypothetical protein